MRYRIVNDVECDNGSPRLRRFVVFGRRARGGRGSGRQKIGVGRLRRESACKPETQPAVSRGTQLPGTGSRSSFAEMLHFNLILMQKNRKIEMRSAKGRE